MELTEKEARAEFNKLSDEELKALAESEGKPTEGFDRADLIELLLGKCPGCKKGSLTVIVIPLKGEKKIQKAKEEPCVGCGKK